MADNNTLNFDLDAPATPTLTLDPAEDLAAPQPQKQVGSGPAGCAPEPGGAGDGG